MRALCALRPLCTGVGTFGEGVGECRRGASVCDPISALARLCASDTVMQGRPPVWHEGHTADRPTDGAGQGKCHVFWSL